MFQWPRESGISKYDSAHYWDGFVKFALFGDSKDRIVPGTRVFNKVGAAYGYMTENAYIVAFDHDVEYLLAAVICVNENGIFNDGVYAYDEVGYPSMANLGRAIHAHEMSRPRPHAPDLCRPHAPDLCRFAPYR
jgi:hypothetical protein